jgi:hypothetical protein
MIVRVTRSNRRVRTGTGQHEPVDRDAQVILGDLCWIGAFGGSRKNKANRGMIGAAAFTVGDRGFTREALSSTANTP